MSTPKRATKKASGPAIKGLERHRQKFRWRTMHEGRRLTFVLDAETEEEAVVEVMALRRNPAIYDMGALERGGGGLHCPGTRL